MAVEALEKIIKFVKTNPITTAIYGVTGANIALTLSDGISLGDVLPLVVSGLLATIATSSAVQRKVISDALGAIIEYHGFNEIVKSKEGRKVARIYAEKHGLMEDYTAAMERRDSDYMRY